MTVRLHVTLDKTTTPWALDIDQSGNANHVSRSPNAQDIVWQLTGNAATGSFVAMSDPNPGFGWIGTAPPFGVFGTPTVSTNGNELTISDTNNSPSTTGNFTYVLRANVGGTVYSTISTLPIETTTNPVIVNK